MFFYLLFVFLSLIEIMQDGFNIVFFQTKKAILIKAIFLVR